MLATAEARLQVSNLALFEEQDSSAMKTMVESVWGLTLESGVSIEAHGMLVTTTFAFSENPENSFVRQFAITKDSWLNDDHAIVWRKQLKLKSFPTSRISASSLALSKNLINPGG